MNANRYTDCWLCSLVRRGTEIARPESAAENATTAGRLQSQQSVYLVAFDESLCGKLSEGVSAPVLVCRKYAV